MNGVAIGRIVHYTDHHNQICPAVIVKVWDHGCVNLQVFKDGTNSIDSPGNEARLSYWATSVQPSDAEMAGAPFAECPQIGRWHWPLKV